MVYLDNAATSQKPQVVLDALGKVREFDLELGMEQDDPSHAEI